MSSPPHILREDDRRTWSAHWFIPFLFSSFVFDFISKHWSQKISRFFVRPMSILSETLPSSEQFVPEQRNDCSFNRRGNYRRRTALYKEHTTWISQPDETNHGMKYGGFFLLHYHRYFHLVFLSSNISFPCFPLLFINRLCVNEGDQCNAINLLNHHAGVSFGTKLNVSSMSRIKE